MTCVNCNRFSANASLPLDYEETQESDPDVLMCSDLKSIEQTPSKSSQPSIRKRKAAGAVDEAFADYLKAQTNVSIEKKSSNQLFLESLLEDMNKLPPKLLRKFKEEIMRNLNENVDSLE